MLSHPVIKVAAKVVGAVLLALSLLYIWQKAGALLASVSADDFTLSMLGILVSGGVVYGALLAFLAIAWAKTANAPPTITLSQIFAIYGRAVLAKYLPGSIFQYASRQLFGAAKGLTQKDMAKASLLEIILHIVCASVIAAVTLIVSGSAIMVAILALAICTLILMLGRHRARFSYGEALALQLLFFGGFAMIVMMAALSIGTNFPEAMVMTAIFMIAWIAGFVVPLAPGGIGVREAVIIALGANIAPGETLLLFAALTRLITLLGDVGFGLSSYWVNFTDARAKRQASFKQ